ncbi:4-hydroxy-tetrahydrodipicolinate reductase [Mariniblastus fucicola]|uniref:4-hydroxy-tetrahydrodipicolinate reductase n=1 Tax=Mariniblastus fucicola TaxID=980251 RepID=A0A5B9PB09_9BACT|nr:4-hydroxy-tetrahydrodipicolinate reductase [Mariniblastus fucicola]QEG23907.1 4-hydroxy-tetrahydrodipicolinate reductase [Mariniblastus fucicola]
MSLKISISGAAGRMGQRLIACAAADEDLTVVDAIDRSEHPSVGSDAGLVAGSGESGVNIGSEYCGESEAVIDFSTPDGAKLAIEYCVANKCPLVMATTGLEENDIAAIKSAAETIPVVWAPSMSLAVNLMMKVTEFVGTALKDLDGGVDVEVIERHHRFKVDSPSGTALKFGQIVGDAMGLTHQQHGREGVIGQRPRNEIGYHAIRAGDDPGQHTILFGMLGEKIELHVAASNRDCYALGALAAAKFVAKKTAGLYNMFDVLGLSDGQV